MPAEKPANPDLNPGNPIPDTRSAGNSGSQYSHTGAANMAATKRPLSSEEKIALVERHFAPMREGKPMAKFSALKKHFGGRNPETLSKAVISAFHERLVDIEVLAVPTAERVTELEQKLTQKYKRRGLNRAIVVKSHPNENSDETHRKLGYALATQLSGEDGSSNIFHGDDDEKPDIIGLGGGRGVFNVCKSLAFELPHLSIRISGVTLVSLTGAVHARHHERRMMARLDADLHCGLFAACIDDRTTLRLINQPIAFLPNELKNAREQTWLNDWNECKPSFALVGVGVFGEGHRFYVEANAEPGLQDPILAPLREPLARLVNCCGKVRRQNTKSAPDYYPVGDICNNLFFIEPPPDANVDRVDRLSIENLINQVNHRLLNVSPEQLREVKLILCAGTLAKLGAIRQLLDAQFYRIRWLCTNQKVAEKLLQS